MGTSYVNTILVIRHMSSGIVRTQERQLTEKHFELLKSKVGLIQNGFMLAKIERV
jgi:hypothetical protein